MLKNHIIPARDRITLDASATARRIDDNGFMHVVASHISKECVNPYYGHEIPGWENLRLDPAKIYHGYRAGAELEKAASTFNGLPLLLDHYVDSAAAPQKEHRVGSLGTDAAFNAPYLDNSLIVTDAAAIDAIESGDSRELSAAYLYDPVFEPGTFNGEAYDFVMTNIRGNHVALVEEGRAGPDVVVADANINPNPKPKRIGIMGLKDKIKKLLAEDSAEETPAAPPAVDEGTPPPAEGTPPAKDEGPEDLGAKLLALVDKVTDPELAGQIKGVIEQMRASAAPAAQDEDPAGETKNDPAPPAKDEEPEETKKEDGAPAMDKKTMPKNELTMDAAKEGLAKHFRALSDAARDVRPLIGDVDPMAFDSANDIYKKALSLSGHNPEAYPASAWRGMCDMLKNAAATAVPVALAQDAASKLDGPFGNLKTIRVEG